MLYSEPEAIYSRIRRGQPTADINRCPSFRNLFKTVYSIDSTIDDEFDLPYPAMLMYAKTPDKHVPLMTDSKVRFSKVRPTAIDGYINVEYNLSWAFFASEPVTVRVTAPYYPAVSPVPGALFSGGEFDIGSWYRPFNMDYHIPLEPGKFSIKEGDPLYYLEVFTDKKVEFKRYSMNMKLMHMLTESVEAPMRYGRNLSLKSRYDMARRSNLAGRVLKEIRANLIE